jgi:DNA-binding MarR family transcriptional regulator/GNAT superfamily N-acetyltransferase
MPVPAQHIATVRAFNRDYTRRIGILQESLHDSPYSLTEVRVLYELANRRGITAAELATDLGLDRGYLSRILKRFTTNKLVAQDASTSDGRRRHLRLTAAGTRCFAGLDGKAEKQIGQMLSELDAPGLQSVLAGMQAIQQAFAPAAGDLPATSRPPTPRAAATPTAAPAHAEITVRSHQPGDMGWVIERHGTLYCREYGWDERFEALVARIAAEFITNLQPTRERCWLAELNGRRVGSIFLVAQNDTTAKLRLLLVEPGSRGLGVGRRLVGECVLFARAAGYGKMVLWTQQNLSAARHLYEQAGFRLTAEEPHHSFGHDLVAETWELKL